VQIQTIDLSPDLVQPGQDLTISANLTILDQTAHLMTNGTIKVECFIANPTIVPLPALFTKSQDFCSSISKSSPNHCPVKDGVVDGVFSVYIPQDTPKVSYFVILFMVAPTLQINSHLARFRCVQS
jgi:hypothetical protein